MLHLYTIALVQIFLFSYHCFTSFTHTNVQNKIMLFCCIHFSLSCSSVPCSNLRIGVVRGTDHLSRNRNRTPIQRNHTFPIPWKTSGLEYRQGIREKNVVNQSIEAGYWREASFQGTSSFSIVNTSSFCIDAPSLQQLHHRDNFLNREWLVTRH